MKRLVLSIAVLVGLPLNVQAGTIKVLRPLSKHMLSLYYWQSLPGNANTPGGGGAVYPVSDETFKVCDNGDNTKCVEFENTGMTTANTIPLTFTGTAAAPGISNAITWGGTQTFNSTAVLALGQYFAIGGNAAGNNLFGQFAIGTPDQTILATGTTSNAWLIVEAADGAAFDFAHALTTNPAVYIHSTNQSTTEFAALDYLGVQPSRVTITVDGATTFALTGGYVLLQCTGAETINTITGATRAGVVLYIENTDTDCTIADDDSATAANAVDLTGAAANDVGAVAKVITLIYNGTHWLQTAESDN